MPFMNTSTYLLLGALEQWPSLISGLCLSGRLRGFRFGPGGDLDADELFLAAHLDHLAPHARAEERVVLVDALGFDPGVERRVQGLEDASHGDLTALGLLELNVLELGVILLGHDEPQGLDGGVEVGLVAVAVSGHVLDDLGHRLRAPALEQRLRLWGRLQTRRGELGVLERAADEGDWDAVDEAERPETRAAAIGQKVLSEAEGGQGEADG
mmetsp:Transcript_12198/g.28603  ORF Transcript_12198/g.28603 Transcript_12198/m.28603 type:complete len:212 (+) Transcript_12198:133-768(+)